MKTDLEIQNDVINELKWNPVLKSTEIGVTVREGIVTLSGRVDSYNKKVAVENAIKKIAGVRAIAESIQVGIPPKYKPTDAEIAEAVLNALKWHASIDEKDIRVKVEHGKVTLEGSVDWAYTRILAVRAVENLTGVTGVVNLIKVESTEKTELHPEDIKAKISEAFRRNANIEAAGVSVEVKDNVVTLRGAVKSISDKEDAELAAWSAPGIVSVENLLQVEAEEYAVF